MLTIDPSAFIPRSAEAGLAYVLEYASKQETGEPGTVTVRDVLGTSMGPLSLAYRVTEARAERYGLAGNTLLEDGAGRAIRVFEGLVLRFPADRVPSIGLTSADLAAVTNATVPAFRKLWLAGTRIDAEPSTEIPVGGAAPGDRLAHLHVAEPYVVPGGYSEPVRAAELRRPPNRVVTSVVIVGLLAALLAWYLTRSSGPTATQAAVSQTCSDLKSGDVGGVYQEFSRAYQHTTGLAAFESRLLGSSLSAICTSTSTTVDQAVLSLRLANGTTRTVDVDFQSESGQAQAIAMQVKS